MLWAGAHPPGQKLEDTTDVDRILSILPFSCPVFSTPALALCSLGTSRERPGASNQGGSRMLCGSPLRPYFGDGHTRPASPGRFRSGVCALPGSSPPPPESNVGLSWKSFAKGTNF
uniref:Uncharacterized protein n=1 Tax=Mus musculus TaxID=10090 RepID=Q3URL5_MOUSE|nr:unnamed protein product [Mus musculus]